MHTHNLEFSRFARDYAAASGARPTEYVGTAASFDGIVRADGRIATRNYIGILTSVNCSATVARAIADHFRRDTNPEALARFPNVDGVVALTHGGGCATASDGEPLQVLRRTLGGYARHPNFASVMVVGLGCETNQINGMLEQEGLATGAQLHAFNIQDSGGTKKTVARRCRTRPVAARRGRPGATDTGAGEPHHGRPAVRRLRRLLGHQRQPGARRRRRPAGAPRRHRHPLRDAGDLWRRAPADAPRRLGEVADKLIARIRWWERYCERNDAEMDNNPSAGNKAGGLTTILEKIAGRDRQEWHDQPGRRVRVRASR